MVESNMPQTGPDRLSVSVPVRYAGLVTRAVALAIDVLAVNAIAAVVAAMVSAIAIALGHHGSLDVQQAAVSAALWAIWVVSYFGGFWAITGQTPGDRVLGIRVVSATGESISALRAVLRVGATAIALLPLGLGFLPVLFDGRRRGLNDYLVGTIVIWVDDDSSTDRLLVS